MKTKRQEVNEYLAELKIGDKLEWLFRITGIKRIVKWINPNCNCDDRQEMLNNITFKRK
jgi:hypothetical protein